MHTIVLLQYDPKCDTYDNYMIYVKYLGIKIVSGMTSINEMGGYIIGLYVHNNQPFCYDDRGGATQLIQQYTRL